MSSSVLRNVIQPKHTPSPAEGTVTGELGEPARTSEDMEAVLGALVENAPVAMAMFDHQMRYILANRSWVEEFSLQGVLPLIGRNQYEVFPGMHPGWRQVYDRALQGHVVRSEHDALSGPDGRRVVYRWEVRPWRRKKDASVGGLMVTCEKFGATAAPSAAAPESDEGEEKFPEPPAKPDLADSTLPMVLLDGKGIVQQTNAAATALGLARGIQEGMSAFWDVYAEPREAPRLQLMWGMTLEKLAGENRESGWIMDIPTPHAQGQNQGQNGTEKPSAPQRWLITLCQSQDGRRYLAVQLPASVVSPPAAARPGFSAAANLPAIASAVAGISQPVSNPEAALQAQEMRRMQDELSRARQELRTLHEAEKVFTQRESRLRQYMDGLPCGVMVLDELGALLYQNDPLTRLLGRPMQKEETVENWLGAACPTEDHREEVTTLWREDVWRRQLTRTFSLATADGLLKELEFQPCSLPGGGLLLCIQDATEHCRHEEQLRATEAKFRTLLHESPLPTVLMDKAGAVFEVNHLAENLLGYPKAELRRHTPDTWLDAESARLRHEALGIMLDTGDRSASVEVQIVRPGGEKVNAVLTLAQVLDARGVPHCTVHFFQKTEELAATAHYPPPFLLSEAEEASYQAPKQPQAVLSAAPMVSRFEPAEFLLLRTNVNGRIKEITPRGQELLGLTEATAKGRALHLHFRPSDATGFYAELSRVAESAAPEAELSLFNQDGSRQPCRLRVLSGGYGGFDFELTELTEIEVSAPAPAAEASWGAPAPQAESQAPAVQNLFSSAWPVADLSREKLLLSETHHRIKNHLQIISSLLNLEANVLSESDVRSALRSSQNRVRAIAELHQHLYQIALGTTESFSIFAEGLVQRLRACYQISEEQVTVQLGLEEGNIQQEWMMPLALTLNETLSNSFEHAFPERRIGTVQVSLVFGPQEGCLTVSDDGIGLPEGFEPSASTGLGLKILGVFAEQMRGKLGLTPGNSGGTEIQLRFPMAYADI